jgi:hypothetical protein
MEAGGGGSSDLKAAREFPVRLSSAEVVIRKFSRNGCEEGRESWWVDTLHRSRQFDWKLLPSPRSTYICLTNVANFYFCGAIRLLKN